MVIVLIALLFRPVINGTDGEVGERIGLSLAHHIDSGEESGSEGGDAGSASDDRINATAQSLAIGSTDSSAANLDAAMAEALGSLNLAQSGVDVSPSQAGSVGDSGLGGGGGGGGNGHRTGSGGSGGTETEFLGIKGKGSSFVFVVDYSDSMSAYSGRPINRAKYELINAIKALGRVNQFQIIFYNDTPSQYGGTLGSPGGLLFANDNEKEAAAQYVRGITPAGGTEHYRALLNALKMSSDVLFFLTDAADPNLTQRQVDYLVAQAESRRTTIHAVQFGIGDESSAGGWISQLAEGTRGEYRYVDVSRMTEN